MLTFCKEYFVIKKSLDSSKMFALNHSSLNKTIWRKLVKVVHYNHKIADHCCITKKSKVFHWQNKQILMKQLCASYWIWYIEFYKKYFLSRYSHKLKVSILPVKINGGSSKLALSTTNWATFANIYNII